MAESSFGYLGKDGRLIFIKWAGNGFATFYIKPGPGQTVKRFKPKELPPRQTREFAEGELLFWTLGRKDWVKVKLTEKDGHINIHIGEVI